MKSRTSDFQVPAVTAFLDAVDQRLNGNSYLLVFATDEPLSDAEAEKTAFAAWLKSPLFISMVDESRRIRGWRGRTKAKKGGGPPMLPEPRPMLASAFAARLWWLLQEAASPYDVVVEPAQARKLIWNFVVELFTAAAWEFCAAEPLDGQFAAWVESDWRFYDVDVDRFQRFFRGYFDDLGGDSATFFGHGETFFLLLSNGTD